QYQIKQRFVMAEAQRPVPFPDPDSRLYWEAARQHEFKLPQCQQCKRILFPPRAICPSCHSTDVTWVAMSGRGTVYSYCIMHDTFIRGMEPPFAIAQVELEDQSGL